MPLKLSSPPWPSPGWRSPWRFRPLAVLAIRSGRRRRGSARLVTVAAALAVAAAARVRGWSRAPRRRAGASRQRSRLASIRDFRAATAATGCDCSVAGAGRRAALGRVRRRSPPRPRPPRPRLRSNRSRPVAGPRLRASPTASSRPSGTKGSTSLADALEHGVPQARVARRDDGEALARTAGAARAADAVDVVVRVRRRGVVEHLADFRDVEAARGDVGRHQQLQFLVAETVERRGALALRQVAVDRRGVEAVAGQRLGDDVDFRLAVAEHDALVGRAAP